MTTNRRIAVYLRTRVVGVMRCAVFTAGLSLTWAGSASAYIGDSFINIPGDAGHWAGEEHKNWIRAEMNMWPGTQSGRRHVPLISGNTNPLAGDKMWFGGPYVPHPGAPGQLIVALGKNNPDVAQMMDRCANKTTIPELTYAESSDRARPPMEMGPRPAEFPAFWEYKLTGVQIVDCPVVADAADQAFVLAFQDIAWLNYDPKRPYANKITLKPEDLPDVKPAEPSAKTKTKVFLITWIAPANNVSEDQCPNVNAKPTDADIFRYMSPEDAAKERAKYGEKGPTYGPETERRGPHQLNATALPGIVPDPGFYEPQSKIAVGFSLDGSDGNGPTPAGTCKHKKYVSEDGRTGIDNQYFTVAGCIPGFRGKKGYMYQTSNARRADGNITTLVEVSNIHDEKNDDNVQIAIIHSMDKPVRDNTGNKFLANFTFRPTEDPNFALYNRRVHGRIVNGVVIADRMPKFQLNLGQDPLMTLINAQLRLEILPDGSMKGVLGGYRDWRLMIGDDGYSEGLFGFQETGQYYAMKRNADGLRDPVTGECNGISMAYEIDAVPAFLTRSPPKGPKMAQNTITAGMTR